MLLKSLSHPPEDNELDFQLQQCSIQVQFEVGTQYPCITLFEFDKPEM